MPFLARELSVLAYANGFTLWHYRTDDPVDALIAADGGYFAAADELMRAGDQVVVTLSRRGRIHGTALVVTAVRPGQAVEVAPVWLPPPLRATPANVAAAEGSLAAAS